MTNAWGKKGGGAGSDIVLESRHLIGLFLGIVVICGVFFTLGFVMGRTEHDSSVRAATLSREKSSLPGSFGISSATKHNDSAPAVPAPSDWTFPRAGDSRKPDDRLEPAVRSGPKPIAPAGNSAALRPRRDPAPWPTRSPETEKSQTSSTAASNSFRSTHLQRGAMLLQVAALTRQTDALALADALQQKQFPAFVLTPEPGGRLFRVQVGPYANSRAADHARRNLLSEGFKTILKR